VHGRAGGYLGRPQAPDASGGLVASSSCTRAPWSRSAPKRKRCGAARRHSRGAGEGVPGRELTTGTGSRATAGVRRAALTAGAATAALAAQLFGLSAARTRRTSASDIRSVRAMAAGFNPALNDAWMRFAFPAGMSPAALTFSLRDTADRPDDAVWSATAAALFWGVARVRRSISALTASLNV
jgi:hypothetical protein